MAIAMPTYTGANSLTGRGSLSTPPFSETSSVGGLGRLGLSLQPQKPPAVFPETGFSLFVVEVHFSTRAMSEGTKEGELSALEGRNEPGRLRQTSLISLSSNSSQWLVMVSRWSDQMTRTLSSR